LDHSVSSDLFQYIFLAGFLQNSGLIVLVLILLVCSALISSSEVALFSLSPSQKESLRESKDGTSQRIITMLEDPDKEVAPRRLLASILIANRIALHSTLRNFFSSRRIR
jgi:putative hemolysin